MDLSGWAAEYEQWKAGAVRHVYFTHPVEDGHLGYVGDEAEGPWAITHILPDGSVTPLFVGDREALRANRPRPWTGRSHVPVPAVVLDGARSTFRPIWGRALLGVATSPRGRVVLLGILGETLGVVLLTPEPVLVHEGRPRECATIYLDNLDLGRRRRPTKAPKSRTPPVAAATTRIGVDHPADVKALFARARAQLAGVKPPARWAAHAGEIPRVLDALERWALEDRGPLSGRRHDLFKTLTGAYSDAHFTLPGFMAALAVLVDTGLVTPASQSSRSWHIHLGHHRASPTESPASAPPPASAPSRPTPSAGPPPEATSRPSLQGLGEFGSPAASAPDLADLPAEEAHLWLFRPARAATRRL